MTVWDSQPLTVSGCVGESVFLITLDRGLAACVESDRLRVGWLNWEGYHESRRCSRDTYPESYITKYTSIRR